MVEVALQLGQSLFVDEIGTAQSDDFRFAGEARAIGFELAANDAPSLDGIVAGGVDEMQEQLGALDMAEEAVADPGAFGSAFDQAGDVGKDELAALVADDSELRAERRERIVADLRRSIGDAVEEGRFARVGKADEADVGEQLQPQPDPHFLALDARLVLARGAVGRAFVAGVAAATHAAFEQHDALAFDRQIGEQAALLVVGKQLRSDGNLDDEVGSAGAGPVRAGAAGAALGAEVLRVAEVDQRIEAGHRLEDDVAALAAVAAVGATEFDELFTAKTDRARATGAGTHVNFRLVEEMHGGELVP